MLASIQFFVSPELKELIGSAADAQGLSMTDWVARTVAEKVKRPDLGVNPKGRPGRPRVHANGNGKSAVPA